MNDVQVELIVYSGRENPRFDLTEDDTVTLASMIETATAGAVEQTPRLGYGGFIVRDPDGRTELPDLVEVFGGIRVCPPRAADGAQDLVDDVGIEAWLLARAREHGHGPLLDALRR